jgi:hypothetical protein
MGSRVSIALFFYPPCLLLDPFFSRSLEWFFPRPHPLTPRGALAGHRGGGLRILGLSPKALKPLAPSQVPGGGLQAVYAATWAPSPGGRTTFPLAWRPGYRGVLAVDVTGAYLGAEVPGLGGAGRGPPPRAWLEEGEEEGSGAPTGDPQ